MKNILFLKWFFIFNLIIVGTIFSYYTGLFFEIYLKDSSYLSFAILAIFYFISSWAGIKTWQISQFINKPDVYYFDEKREIKKFRRLEEIGWFFSELCLTLGMTGTVVGFIMMLAGFDKIDVNETSSVQGFIGDMGGGMATALYTTLVGLICSALLKMQYFNIKQKLDEIEV